MRQIIGGSSDKHSRQEMDLYETPAECTRALVEFMRWSGPSATRNLITWEPAAGNGAITRVFESYGHIVHSSDIVDRGWCQVRDFLECNPAHFSPMRLIVTNPPYSHAEEFIRHALKFDTDAVAMLLKSTFWHAGKRLSLFNEHPPAYVLPLSWRPAMCPDRGHSGMMDFAWRVWRKNPPITQYKVLRKPDAVR